MTFDLYQTITDSILASLEAGVAPWTMPWKSYGEAIPTNAATRKPYRGVNMFLLGMVAQSKGYSANRWLTYNQAKNCGGNVRKGEKSTMVVFWKMLDGKDQDGKEKKIPFLRYFSVFNVAQCDDLPARCFPVAAGETREHTPCELAEKIVAEWNEKPEIKHGGSRAVYTPALDKVTIPNACDFVGGDEYYSTLFHELTHATGHKSRLAREGVTNPIAFGSDPYGREELIAEMGAAFLCGFCGIESVREMNASYLAAWIKVIKGDKKLVMVAAGQAQKAADLILASQKVEVGEEVEAD